MGYLVLVVVVSAVGVAVVLLRRWESRSVNASIDRFEKARRAISPARDRPLAERTGREREHGTG